MSSDYFRLQAASFRLLIQQEEHTTETFDALTLAEDMILDHSPTSFDEIDVILEVLRIRYGEDEDRPLHHALSAIVDFARAHKMAVAA